MPSKAFLIEQFIEAAREGRLENFRGISDQLEKRIQYPEAVQVIPLDPELLQDMTIGRLLDLLCSTSETVGECGLSPEAARTARENQKKLMQTIKGRFNDLTTKLQQVNEISGGGSNNTDT